MTATPKPLTGRTIAEVAHPTSDDVTRLSIAFAGRIAADLGANVVRVHGDGHDPLDDWPPALPEGGSAISTFLHRGKTICTALPTGDADLLTNDRAAASAWRSGAVVLTESSLSAGEQQSELTILASSGLLDIFGDPGRRPLATPGHQAAYSAGLAAYNALISSVLALSVSGQKATSHITVVDIAKWLNWKHFLAAYLEQYDSGIGRPEEWTTVQCLDGYIALVFQDKDVPALAKLTGEDRLNDPEFRTPKERRQNIAAFNKIFSDWAISYQRNEILDRASELKLPLGPVLKVADLFTDRQMLARKFMNLEPGSPDYGVPRLPAVWVDAA